MRKLRVFVTSIASIRFYLIVVLLVSILFILAIPLIEGGTIKERVLGYSEEEAAQTVPAVTGGKLAIVIDDFGSSRLGVNEMMSIKEHLTFAVMPFLDNTLEDAEIAHGNG